MDISGLQILVNPLPVKMVHVPHILGDHWSVQDEGGKEVAQFAIENQKFNTMLWLKVGNIRYSTPLHFDKPTDPSEAEVVARATIREALDRLLGHLNMVLTEEEK